MAMMMNLGGGSPAPGVTMDGQLEQIHIFIGCKTLPKTPGGTTDPFALVYARNPVDGRMSLIHTTECKTDTYNPHFTQPCKNSYSFEMIQDLEVHVKHKNRGTAIGESPAHTLLGVYRFSQSELMMAPGQRISARFIDGHLGSIQLRGEQVGHTRDLFKATIACNGLPRMNGFGICGKSDPFVRIYRVYDDGSETAVFETEHRPNNLSPVWPTVQKEMSILCNGNIECGLKIEVLDYNPNGRHVPMGYKSTTLKEILESNGVAIELICRSKGCFGGKATIAFKNALVENHPTLVQYLQGGLEVNLNVAIDFTQSNGHPSEIRSLHRAFRPGQPENDYEKAIRAVGGVIEAYDKDKKFAVYGFGARIGQDRQVSHCFPVYGGESIVQGVEGVIHAYRDCVNAVELAGPTYFKHLIDNAGALAERMNCTQDNQKYTVLLILTDGVIDDMNETIASIVRASYLPLSIIIVGIGNEDFRDMGKLDGDSVKLAHGTVEAIRDIVQFVPFKKYSQTGPTVLAQNVLAEVPAQILKFMDMKKIKPNGAVPPPPAFDEANNY